MSGVEDQGPILLFDAV